MNMNMHAYASRPANRGRTSSAREGRGRASRRLPASAYGAVAGGRRRIEKTRTTRRPNARSGGANACRVLNVRARAPVSFRGWERSRASAELLVSFHGEAAPAGARTELTRPCPSSQGTRPD
jgi:hypothetical protein